MTPTIGRVAARTTGLIVLAAALTACGSVQERVEDRITREVVEQALGDGVELREDGFSVETEDGSTLDVGSGQLPAAWPSDLTVPSGGQVLSSVVQEGADRTEIAAMIGFDGEFEDVRAKVEDAFAGTAWTADGDTTSVETEEMRAWGRSYVSGESTSSVSVVDTGDSITVSWQVELAPGS